MGEWVDDVWVMLFLDVYHWCIAAVITGGCAGAVAMYESTIIHHNTDIGISGVSELFLHSRWLSGDHQMRSTTFDDHFWWLAIALTNLSVTKCHLLVARLLITSPISHDILLHTSVTHYTSWAFRTLYNTMKQVGHVQYVPPLMANQWACFNGFTSKWGLVPLTLSHGWLYIVAPSAGNTLDFSLWLFLASIMWFMLIVRLPLQKKSLPLVDWE
jgi:hypothetical protein